jgi:SAM-dependent methyltransferase
MKRDQSGKLMNHKDLLCPICQDPGSKSASARVTLGPEDHFDLLRCMACGTRFFHPLPTDRQLSAFYAAEYYTFDRENEEGKGRCFAHWLSRLQTTGKFLDVGCATGFMLNGISQDSVWELYGCELSPEASAFARDQLGLHVSTGQLVDASYPDRYFDVVQVNNVLEHVLDPAGLLREIHRILKPQGRVLLNVPNGANDVLPIEVFWRTEHLPAHSKDGHLFFFPAVALRHLFKQTGFCIQRQKTYSLKRGLRNLGWLPPKRDWKTAYFPRRTRNARAGILPPPGHRRKPSWYHAFRYYTGHWKAIPGLHAFGLDFSFLLRLAENE